jgi:cytochrome P450
MALKLDEHLQTAAFAADPFPVYAALREADPVHWSDYWQAWVLTRYDDIKSCLSDTETFSSRGRAISHFSTLFTSTQLQALGPLQQQFLEGLISSDPPDHSRLKRVMLRGIRPMNDEGLKEVVWRLVSELLGEVKNRGSMDAIADFAYPLPIYVTLAILGVAQSERDRLKSACESFLQLSTNPRPSFTTALESQAGLLEIKAEFARLLAHRRTRPERDFISNLAEAEREGVLSESEILTTLVTVLIGGHETTTYLLGSSLWILNQYPDQLQMLRNDPSLLPTATEEFIRLVGPFQYVRRIVTRDVQLRGKNLRKGELVMVHLAAGNRDPAVFPDPEILDITRNPNRHLGFGHGPHACLGAPFARSEVPIALELFFRHIADYEVVAVEIDFPNHSLRGPDRLPLKLKVGRATEGHS